MRDVTLLALFQHPITQKYLTRSGIHHAITCAYHAFELAKKEGVSVDLATKAALLHDMGHYTWYKDGKWDYSLYKENDIHAIKGAERAHKLLIRLGENPIKAKDIALAILLHTDSYLEESAIKRNPLQLVTKCADEMDEQAGGMHHYQTISTEEAIKKIIQLDQLVEQELRFD